MSLRTGATHCQYQQSKDYQQTKIFHHKIFYLIFLQTFVQPIGNKQNSNNQESIADTRAIYLDMIIKLVHRNNTSKIITCNRQNGIPYQRSKSGKDDKIRKFHFRQACRYRYKVSDCGHQTTDKSRYRAMMLKETFRLIYFLFVEHKQVSQLTISELINDRTSQPTGQTIIGQCPY